MVEVVPKAVRQEDAVTLQRRPITLRDAQTFISQHHRHSDPPQGWLCGVSVWNNETIVAVGVLGRPVAQQLQDGQTAEITRVATIEANNVATMIYGALCRVAEGLGYTRVISYTLASETGATLRAAGFTYAATVDARASWSRPNRERPDQLNLFGFRPRRDPGAKVRWERHLR